MKKYSTQEIIQFSVILKAYIDLDKKLQIHAKELVNIINECNSEDKSKEVYLLMDMLDKSNLVE